MANTFKFGNDNWAVKDGQALAYNDENNNFKPLPFEFTRASTATRVNRQGLVEVVPIGKPRIDFLDNTKGHLLLEPSRTNRVPYSVFDGNLPTGWSVGFSQGTFTHELTSFRGQSAIKHTQTSSSGRSFLFDAVSFSASTTYTCSFYVDLQNSGDILSTEFIASIILTDATGTTSVRFGDADENGLVSFTFTTGTDTTGDIRLGFGCAGTSYAQNKPLIFSMPQIEEGSYPTSYIPTEGSSITRVAEVANGAGNSTLFNDSEGVLFVEIAALANLSGLSSRRITVTDDSGANYNNIVSLELDENANTLKGFVSDNSGNITSVSTTNLNLDENNKIALKYNSASTNLYINGSEVDSATSTNLPTGLVKLDFDSGRSDEIQDFYGKCKQIKVYNTALTDTELQNLTS